MLGDTPASKDLERDSVCGGTNVWGLGERVLLDVLAEVDELVDAAGEGLEEEDLLRGIGPREGGALFLSEGVLTNEDDA